MYVWDSNTAEVTATKRVPKGGRLVSALGFSSQDRYLAACDMAEKITVHIFDLGPKGKQDPIADVQIGQKVMHLAWNPNSEDTFATVGKDHMYLCTFTAGKGDKKASCSKKKGSVSGKGCSHSSIAWSADKKTMFTGGADGKLYQWTGASTESTAAVCKGAVHSVATADDGGNEIVLAGGNDKTISIFNFKGKLDKIKTITL